MSKDPDLDGDVWSSSEDDEEDEDGEVGNNLESVISKSIRWNDDTAPHASLPRVNAAGILREKARVHAIWFLRGASHQTTYQKTSVITLCTLRQTDRQTCIPPQQYLRILKLSLLSFCLIRTILSVQSADAVLMEFMVVTRASRKCVMATALHQEENNSVMYFCVYFGPKFHFHNFNKHTSIHIQFNPLLFGF